MWLTSITRMFTDTGRRGAVHNEDVLCKDCGKRLAHWDMFHNTQYEEEWECPAMFRHKILSYASIHNRKSHCNVQTGEFQIPVHSEMNYCALIYETKYCKRCARRRNFSCGRPRCKGHLVKVRKEDGGYTKHTHGGF